ncbi:unnamed protein product, partial [Porites evermanni]
GKKRARDKDRNRKCRNTKKASTELSLLSTAVHAAVFFFQLFLPMIIRLRHIVSGIPGVNGLPGSTGAPGHDGRDGIRGEQGSPGKTGPQGPTGAKGMKGERCITGPVGPKGDRRERGDSGIQAGPHNKCSHLNWKECTFTRVDGKERSISKLSSCQFMKNYTQTALHVYFAAW